MGFAHKLGSAHFYKQKFKNNVLLVELDKIMAQSLETRVVEISGYDCVKVAGAVSRYLSNVQSSHNSPYNVIVRRRDDTPRIQACVITIAAVPKIDCPPIAKIIPLRKGVYLIEQIGDLPLGKSLRDFNPTDYLR